MLKLRLDAIHKIFLIAALVIIEQATKTRFMQLLVQNNKETKFSYSYELQSDILWWI